MTDRLKNDVLFVNVDGMQDYFNNQVNLFRNKIVKDVKNNLEKNGLRVLLLNTLKDSDVQIPVFPYSTDFQNQGWLDYNIFLLKYLYDHIKHESFTHVVIFQHDGYPINLQKWDDMFLDYEYIGRMDLDQNISKNKFFSFKENRNGVHFNGGFSIRSRDLIKRCKDIPLEEFKKIHDKLGHHNEDIVILDYLDYNKLPKKSIITRNFSSKSEKSDSFGFHIT